MLSKTRKGRFVLYVKVQVHASHPSRSVHMYTTEIRATYHLVLLFEWVFRIVFPALKRSSRVPFVPKWARRLVIHYLDVKVPV